MGWMARQRQSMAWQVNAIQCNVMLCYVCVLLLGWFFQLANKRDAHARRWLPMKTGELQSLNAKCFLVALGIVWLCTYVCMCMRVCVCIQAFNFFISHEIFRYNGHWPLPATNSFDAYSIKLQNLQWSSIQRDTKKIQTTYYIWIYTCSHPKW